MREFGTRMIGTIGAVALAGLSPVDPIGYGAAALVLILTGAAATYIPARRAARLNPIDALRAE